MSVVDVEKVEPCKCEVGFTCDRKCDLDYIDCIQKHYYHRCGHNFTQWFNLPDGGTLICEKCGVSAINHDAATGP